MAESELAVGEVARRSGVAVSALHFYERKGLISSLRTAGNQRRYARDVLRRLAVIRVAQRVGMPLEAVARAFETLPQGRHARGQPGQQQAQQEAGQAPPQWAGGAVAVGPAPGHGHADHAGGQRSAKGQCIQAQAVQRLGHGGHGRCHRQRLEGQQCNQYHHAHGGGAVGRGQNGIGHGRLRHGRRGVGVHRQTIAVRRLCSRCGSASIAP